jgi:hypothetical protein
MQQLTVHGRKPLDFHTQTTKQRRENISCILILPKYVKICSLWTLERRQKQRVTCSVPCQAGRAWTGRGSARRHVRSSHPACLRLAPAYKCPKALAVFTRAPKAPPEPVITEVRREREAPRPPPLPEHGRHGQPFPSTPSLARALGKLPREAVKLFQA